MPLTRHRPVLFDRKTPEMRQQVLQGGGLVQMRPVADVSVDVYERVLWQYLPLGVRQDPHIAPVVVCQHGPASLLCNEGGKARVEGSGHTYGKKWQHDHVTTIIVQLLHAPISIGER